MKLKVVTTDKGRVFVDESIGVVDDDKGYFYDFNYNKITKTARDVNGDKYHARRDIKKIVASIDFSIDKDLPMAVVEYDVQKLAVEFANDNKSKFNNWYGCRDGFIAGSNKQKGVYSEEDLISFGKKCFYKGFNKSENDDANCFTAWKEEAPELIMDLKQEYIELEIEEVYSGETLASASGFSLKTDAIKSIKTSRVDGQLMAYLKQ